MAKNYSVIWRNIFRLFGKKTIRLFGEIFFGYLAGRQKNCANDCQERRIFRGQSYISIVSRLQDAGTRSGLKTGTHGIVLKGEKYAAVLVDVSTITPSDLMNHFKNMTEGRKITRHAFGNAKGLLNQLFDLAR